MYLINLNFLSSLTKIEKQNYENNIEWLLGMRSDIDNDTISPDVHLNLYRKARGKPLGPDLIEQAPEIEEITRLTLIPFNHRPTILQVIYWDL